jgi:hypothetical protein
MMEMTAIPASYQQWKHCIEVECGIQLTAEFIDQRISVLEDTNAEETARFKRLYGDGHWRRVLGWFHTAKGEQ